MMNVLVIGDIVGKPGRKVIKGYLPSIIEEYNIDFVVANGENSAGGLSITPQIAAELFDSKIDIITTGNHIFRNKSIIDYLNNNDRLLRPANYPQGVPGNGFVIINKSNVNFCVINLMGRINILPIDCPFRKFDDIYNQVKNLADIIIVDFHAEATSEKIAFGWYVDGRASAVCGTHTHVQTADERILPEGTAYITDIGMTGSFNSVIGMDKNISIDNFLFSMGKRFTVAKDDIGLNAIVVKFNSNYDVYEVVRIFRKY